MLALLALSALADAPAFAQIATGEDFTCARSASGQVWCWGNNEDQQLGVDRILALSTEPVETSISNSTDISASAGQACSVSSSGELRCWGQVNQASWGTGVLPTRPRSSDAASASVGPARGCSRHRGGRVSCWEPTATQPPPITAVPQAQQVAVGAEHACARVSGGAVWCWGEDDKGQLGNKQPGPSTLESAVPDVFGAIDLAAGEHNTCAVLDSGQIKCWGPNGDGNLGIGTTEPTWGPQTVRGIADAVEVSVGQRQACARTATGKVLCWGADPCPRPGAPTRRMEPVDIGIRGAVALSKGSLSEHMCAVVGGKPICWGFNSHGQAGAGERCISLTK